jgi:hypothetical protein
MGEASGGAGTLPRRLPGAARALGVTWQGNTADPERLHAAAQTVVMVQARLVVAASPADAAHAPLGGVIVRQVPAACSGDRDRIEQMQG